jgi:hypothetical protein
MKFPLLADLCLYWPTFHSLLANLNRCGGFSNNKQCLQQERMHMEDQMHDHAIRLTQWCIQ